MATRTPEAQRVVYGSAGNNSVSIFCQVYENRDYSRTGLCLVKKKQCTVVPSNVTTPFLDGSFRFVWQSNFERRAFVFTHITVRLLVAPH